MRRAHRNPRAHRKPDVVRLVARGRRRYRRLMRLAGLPIHHDWVRLISSYSLEVAGENVVPGRWTYSRWMPKPGGGWYVEMVSTA